MAYTVCYASIDRFSQTRKIKTMEAARRFAVKYVGETPDMGSHYAVSFDGIGKITVTGCTLQELFAGKLAPAGGLPFEVWSYIIDEDRGTSRPFKDGTFATLYDAEQKVEEIERYADGVHIVATTDAAKEELRLANEAYRDQLMVRLEVRRHELFNVDENCYQDPF